MEEQKSIKIFITGATGFIGIRLSLKLAEEGYRVHALFRSSEKAKFLNHPNIKLFKGDILDIQSISKAVEGCSVVYHVAAFTEIWIKDESIINKLNVTGFLNVLNCAKATQVKKVIFTSTAGVFGPSDATNIIDEKTERKTDFFLEYERTKALAEKIALKHIEKDFEIVIVNPTRVYGPGLLSQSNSVTKMIKQYIHGKWRFLPGNGKSIGNYVYVDDVVKGHIAAMKKGRSGEKYILGGENASYIELFNTITKILGYKYRMIKIPLFIMILIAKVVISLSRIFGITPFITPALVRKFNYNWNVSSAKAIKELNYQITSLESGIKNTITWLNQNNL